MNDVYECSMLFVLVCAHTHMFEVTKKGVTGWFTIVCVVMAWGVEGKNTSAAMGMATTVPSGSCGVDAHSQGAFWVSGTARVLGSTPFHLQTGVGTVAKGFSTLRLQTSSVQGKGAQQCSGIVGAGVDAQGSPVSRAMGITVDPPVRMFTLETAGWVPSQVVTMSVRQSSPADGDGARLRDRVSALAESITQSALGLVTSLERFYPGALAAALDTASGVQGPVGPVGPAEGPGRLLQDPITETIIGGIALGVATTALATSTAAMAIVADGWRTMNNMEDQTRALSNGINATQTAFIQMNKEVEVLDNALQVHGQSLSVLQTSINTSRQWMSETSTQVGALTTNLVAMSKGMAERQERADAMATLIQASTERQVSQGMQRIQALGDATRNATVALAATSVRHVEAQYSAMAAAQQGFAASLDAIALANTATESAMDRVQRLVNTLITMAPLRRMLVQRLHSTVAASALLGFVPFVKRGWRDRGPGPRAAWAHTSALRVITVDTLVHVGTTPVDVLAPTAGVVVNHTRVTFQCDPLASPESLVPSMTTSAFLDTLAPEGRDCDVAGGEATPLRPVVGRPCVCWFRVQRSGCVATSPQGAATTVLPPAFASGPDHPRTLTWAGLRGWLGATNGTRVVPGGGSAPGVRLNASSPGPAGFVPLTPCAHSPWEGDVDFVVNTHGFRALMQELTCPSLGSAWNSSVDPDAVVASAWNSGVREALAEDRVPYLRWFPVPNGARTRVEGWQQNAPQGAGTAGPGTTWVGREAPVCTVVGQEGVAAWRQGVWPTPVGYLLEFLGYAWPEVYPSVNLALRSAFGVLHSDIRQVFQRFSVEPGVTRSGPGQRAPVVVSSLGLEVPLLRGHWVPVGTATEQGTWVRGDVRLGPAPVSVHPIDPARVRVFAPLSNTLPPRATFMCDLECATGVARGGLGCVWPLFGRAPPGPAPGLAPRYVCDAPESAVPVAGQASLRVNTMTYLWWAARVDAQGVAQAPPSLSNFTQEDWEAAEGVVFDHTKWAGTVQDVLVELVDAVAAGVTPVATGLSDYVCKVPGAGYWCRTLDKNVLFTPDLQGAHAHLVGTQLQGCGRGALMCLIPRQYTMVASGVVVPLGSVATTLVRTCPVVDTARANVTGYPRFWFRNGGTADLQQWWYSWVPVNTTDPSQWLPGVNASVVDRVCVATDVVQGPALSPGASMPFTWFTVCATWNISTWVLDPETGTRVSCPPVTVALPVKTWAGSSGSSESSSSWGGAVGGSAALSVSIVFDSPVVDTRPAEGIQETSEVVQSLYVTNLQNAIIRNATMDIALAEMGLWDLFQQACDASGVNRMVAAQSEAALSVVQGNGSGGPGAPGSTLNFSAQFVEEMNARAGTLRRASANTSVTAVMYGTIARETRALQTEAEASVNASGARLADIETASKTRYGVLQQGVSELGNRTLAFEEEIRSTYEQARARFDAQVKNATDAKNAALKSHSKPHKNRFLMQLFGLHVVVVFAATFLGTVVIKRVTSSSGTASVQFQPVSQIEPPA